MPSDGRSGRRSVMRVVGAVLSCALLAAGLVTSARAAPRPTIGEVRARVDALHEQAEAATERYNGLREDIAALGVRLEAARSRVAQEQELLARARADLSEWAAQTYKAGDLATASLLFSDDPDAVLAASGTMDSLTDRRSEVVERLGRQQRAVVGATTDLEEQQQKLQAARRDLERERGDVRARLVQAQQELARLTGGERAQLAAQENGQDRSGLSQHGVKLPSGRPTCADVPLGTFDARVSKVIAYACAQLGDPYQWGASGPGRFDCSGLTMMAWRQAGVDLPHNAAMQAELGTPVSRADLRPGDLVFFYDPIGHNGIYLGNGLMIHAPRTGDFVKIAPVDGIRSLTAAVRL